MTRPLRATPAGQQLRLHAAEVLASIGVLLAAVMLIALVWLVESRAVQAQSDEQRARVEARVGGQALLLAEQIRRDMLGVEQSLRVLKAAFEDDPDHFDLAVWCERMPALTDVTDDAFIADAQFIIRHALNQSEIGLDIDARAPGTFAPPTGRPGPEKELLAASGMQMLQTREHELLMLLRLERPVGWLVGVAYRTGALKRLFAEANLGVRGMTSLIEMRAGRVDAVIGLAATNSNNDIAKSPMYAAMRARPDGVWVGESAPDGVRRIHGFHQIPGHPFAVVVAVDETAAMQPAIAWALDARALTFAATAVVLAAAGVLLYAIWTLRSKRRLRQSLQRELVVASNAQTELTEARARLGGRAGQVQALLGAIEEGVLMLDPAMHLIEWNARLPVLLGIAPEALQSGLPLDELLRAQASEGASGALEDSEAEVTRRVALLRRGSDRVPAIYPGPGGRPLAVFCTQHSDGSVLLILRSASEQELLPALVESVAEMI